MESEMQTFRENFRFSKPLFLGMSTDSLLVKRKLGDEAFEILKFSGTDKKLIEISKWPALVNGNGLNGGSEEIGKAFPSEKAARLWAEISGLDVVFLNEKERNSPWLGVEKVFKKLVSENPEILESR